MSKKCILIIDDEKDILEFLSITLGGGYEILTANSGEIGLQLVFEKKTIDLILLDIMMPKMNGWEVLQLLQVESNTKNIPIIMLTAKSDISSKIRSNQEGATDYLTKPFELDELKERIFRILSPNGISHLEG